MPGESASCLGRRAADVAKNGAHIPLAYALASQHVAGKSTLPQQSKKQMPSVTRLCGTLRRQQSAERGVYHAKKGSQRSSVPIRLST
jgi:hypothetical protein